MAQAGQIVDMTERRPRTGRDSPLFVGSLEKGLRVLGAFDETRRSLRLTEIAAATGLDKSAAQRFTHTLFELGYLRKDVKTKHYSLAPKVLELGFTYLRTDALVERAAPYLLEASRRSEETVNLTELDGTEVVYVARVPSRHVISVDVILGTWLPAYCTATGRAILAFLPEDEARDILERSDRIAYTEVTETDLDALMGRLAEARRDGFAVAAEEYYIGDLSIAAPGVRFLMPAGGGRQHGRALGPLDGGGGAQAPGRYRARYRPRHQPHRGAAPTRALQRATPTASRSAPAPGGSQYIAGSRA